MRRLSSLVARRPWHVGAAALAAGLVLADAPRAAPLAAAAVAAASLVALRTPGLGALAAGLVLAGAALGELRLAALDAPAGRIRDGDRVAVIAELQSAPRPAAFGASAELKVTSGALRGARLLARAARWAPLPRRLRIGEELRIADRLSALRAAGRPAPGARAERSRGPPFDYDAYLRRHGIAGVLMVERARRTGRRRGGLAGALDDLRERAARAVAAGMPAREAALLEGMVLGRDERIDAVTRDDWRRAGLAHLLAVSGQNVMLLAALALPLLAVARLGLRARLAALAALTVGYVPLAGAGPSLQRAGVMGLAGIAATASSRPASRSYGLLLAVVATLAWNPRAWGDPGWQLSFAAVAGILLAGVPLRRFLHAAVEGIGPGGRPRAAPLGGALLGSALLRGLADGVAITVSATLASAPLVAHHFGSVPAVGLPANVLALPAVAPAMWLGMLKVALGALSAGPAPVASAAQAGASTLGTVAGVPVAYLAGLAERLAAAPGGQLRMPLASWQAVLGAYAAMGASGLGLARRMRAHTDPAGEAAARWHALPRGRRRALAAALAAVLLAAGAALAGGARPPDRLTIRFLDVGQGDATLIQEPDGTAVLFDGGPPEAGVAGLLRRAGVRRLTVVVATHPSRDHHGGLVDVLRRFPVDLLLDGGDGTADPGFRSVLREAAARGVRRVRATAPLALTAAGGRMRIRILAPEPRPPGPPPEDPNPRGVIALVSAGDLDLLLSADAEGPSLLPLDLPDVDALKVPHHGSSDPDLPAVLARLHPELAAIEVGAGNTYGHPAPSTLAALRRAHVRTFRTDRDGTVTVTPDGDAMRVETER